MILPNKYINLSESLFGFSAYLGEFLNNPVSLDELWETYQQHVKNGDYPVKNDFNELVLSIDLLYLMGLIEVTNNNEIGLTKNYSSKHILPLPKAVKEKNMLEDSNLKSNASENGLYETH